MILVLPIKLRDMMSQALTQAEMYLRSVRGVHSKCSRVLEKEVECGL